MTRILVRLDRSEPLAKKTGLPQESRTIEFDNSDGSWVQFTYSTLRTQDGSTFSDIGYDAWRDVWRDENDHPWSDLVIEFKDGQTMAAKGDLTSDERRLVQHVLDECETCGNAPTTQPAWRLRSALTESARLIRQLLDDMPLG